MKISEIINKIETIVPLSDALDYDNPGLNVGSIDKECTGILLCVDVTSGAVESAIKNGCNLVISHHPIIFTPIRNFVDSDYRSKIISLSFEKGITIYSVHTNMDRYSENMSVISLKEIGAKNVRTFCDGFGAIGDVDDTMLNISNKIASILDDNRTFTIGDDNRIIRRVAMINGAGADEDTIMTAIGNNVDLFVSSEFKHHLLIMAKENGLGIMSVGHYASEKGFVEIVAKILSQNNIRIEKYYEGNLYN